MPFFLRSLEVDVGKRFTLAAAVLFLLGFLPMPLGSLATVLFFAMAIVALTDIIPRRVPLRFPPPTGFAVAACLIYFAVDAASLIIYDNRADGWIPVVASLHFLLLPILFAGLLPARMDPIKVFVRGAQIGAIVGAIIAVIQNWAGIDRAVGGMINSFPFGATAAWFACISLIGVADAGRSGRTLAAIAFSAGLTAALLSEARGAWLALPVLMVILLFYLRAQLGGRIAVIAAGGLAVISMVVIVAAGDSLRERFNETFVMFQGFEFGQADPTVLDVYSLDQRALLMAYGLEAAVDRPILGYGPQNAVAEVRARAAVDGHEIDQYGHLHNEFLTETVGNGLVGLATLLLLLAAPIVTAYRSARDSRYADRQILAVLMTTGAVLFGLTSLAFGHDITNSIYASALLVICLSAAASGPRVPRSAEP